MTNADVLLLAMDLAILTYVIGVLIMALPIPYAGFKRWGVRLIADGISAAVLISIFSIIITLGDLLLGNLNVSWPSFHSWLAARTAVLVAVFTALTYLTSALKATPYAFITSPINIALTYVSLALSSLKVIYFLSSLVSNLRNELAALGILLYSIPFRVGRSVGAFLIAASIVMYVGFPLMPAFIAQFQPSNLEQFRGVMRIQGKVVDSLYHRVPYPLMYFYSTEGGEEPLGVIIGDRNGTFTIGGGKDILPREFKFLTEVGFMGYYFSTEPSYISSNESTVVLRVPSLIYSSGLALLKPRDVRVEDYIVGNGILSVVLTGNEGFNDLVLAKLANTTVTKVTINDEVFSCSWNPFEWNGIDIEVCEIKPNDVGAGKLNVTVKYTPTGYVKPAVDERRITYIESVSELLLAYISLGIAYVYTFIFLPGVYVTFLVMMSAALARVFGGGARIRLI